MNIAETAVKRPGIKFPKGPNPAATLANRKLEVCIVQDEGSLLSATHLLKGYTGLQAAQWRQWHEDIIHKRFRLERIPTNLDPMLTESNPNNEICPQQSENNNNSDHSGRDRVPDTAQTGGEDLGEEEEEAWEGLGV